MIITHPGLLYCLYINGLSHKLLISVNTCVSVGVKAYVRVNAIVLDHQEVKMKSKYGVIKCLTCKCSQNEVIDS
jgi:hypothetical protein